MPRLLLACNTATHGVQIQAARPHRTYFTPLWPETVPGHHLARRSTLPRATSQGRIHVRHAHTHKVHKPLPHTNKRGHPFTGSPLESSTLAYRAATARYAEGLLLAIRSGHDGAQMRPLRLSPSCPESSGQVRVGNHFRCPTHRTRIRSEPNHARF